MHRGYPADKFLADMMREIHRYFGFPKTNKMAVGLGGVGVTLRDLVSIYTAIARGGSPVRLKDGVKPPAEGEDELAPVLDPVAAWYVTDILRDVPPPLTGMPGRIAFKTGTSYGFRDAWSVGYDGKTVIGEFAVPALILGVFAIAAGLIPARRAAAVDPGITLRDE